MPVFGLVDVHVLEWVGGYSTAVCAAEHGPHAVGGGRPAGGVPPRPPGGSRRQGGGGAGLRLGPCGDSARIPASRTASFAVRLSLI